MRNQLKDPDRLAHILEAIENVFSFMQEKSADDLQNDKLLYYAVVKNVEIVGEAAYKLSKEFKEEHPEIPWRLIEKMRHIMVHGYYNISIPILYNVYTEDLPLLKSFISGL
ncbi:MAG: DUF86 domain-containing protein [Muribaculaceae bacterium]|nr:DUF86 domain-containing protein [Muribaculaceae bacterium]